ncbi:type II toxin-antitoxin system VapC family toxin [Gemmatimonadota bacterium]
MIVVDTNVMVYLLTGSTRGEDAARLLAHDPEWAAPPILLSELRNVLVGLVRRGHIGVSDAVGICEDAQAVLGERVVSVPATPVLTTATESTMSAYDAEFVVLARRLAVPLVTADRTILLGAPDVAARL